MLYGTRHREEGKDSQWDNAELREGHIHPNDIYQDAFRNIRRPEYNETHLENTDTGMCTNYNLSVLGQKFTPNRHVYTATEMFGVSKVFERYILCSPRLHLVYHCKTNEFESHIYVMAKLNYSSFHYTSFKSRDPSETILLCGYDAQVKALSLLTHVLHSC